jgi:uncharacterized protein (DUF2141 family)
MPRRRVGAAVLAAIWGLSAAATPVGRLDVQVDALRSTKGVVRLCLTADPASFPACHNDPRAVRRNLPATASAITLEGLAPGAYALALMHDENGNHRLDKLAGIPREGFGFSRNPAIRFGPPRFDAARFQTTGDGDRQRVRMQYFL